MLSFLEEAIEGILEENDDVSNLRIILPSKRACGFFKHYLKKKLDRATFLPSIISIEEFIELIADLQIITNRQFLLYSYNAYLQTDGIEQKDNFEVFCNWIQPLLADINEIDRHLVETAPFFNYMLGIKTLEKWNATDHQTKLIKNYLSFWKALPNFYKILIKLLHEKGLGYQGMVYRKACEELEHYIQSTAGLTHYFLGFNALNTAEQFLIKELLETRNAHIIWDADQAFFEERPHSASYFMKAYFTSWKHYHKGWPKLQNNFEQPKTFNFVQAQQGVSQVKTAGEILAGLNVKELSRTALVLPDESLLVPLLQSLPKPLEKVNVTMGVPLSNFPLTELFRSVLYLHTKNENLIYYKDLFTLLQHPIAHRILPVSENLMQEAASNNLAYISPDFILQNCYGSCQRVASILFKPWEGQAAKALSKLKLLVEEIRSNARLSKTERVVLFELNQVLEEIFSVYEQHQYIKSTRSVMLLFDDAVANSSVDFMGDAYDGLQIMGVLETRTLDFENVIMLSVNEGVFPAGKSSASYLTYDLKKEFGLPMYDEKDAVYSYHFYRLLQRSKNCWLIYNGVAEGMDAGEKSRFLLQLETEQKEQHTINHLIAHPAVELHKKSSLIIAKTDSVMLRLGELIERGLSPSALTTYIRNPVDFYFRYVLQVKPMDMLEEVVEYTTLGSIVHNSLEKLYTPLVGRSLRSSELENLLMESDHIVVREFDALFKKGNYQKGKNLLIFEVAKKYVSNLIKMDLATIKEGNRIELIAIEEELSSTISLKGLSAKCYFRGMVDRVDRLNGTIRIIDYKTGTVQPGDLNITDWQTIVEDYKYSKAFQVLMYALLMNENSDLPPVQAGIISFKNMSQGFMGFGQKSSPGAKNTITAINREVLDNFTLQLGSLVAQILDPDIPFEEKEV